MFTFSNVLPDDLSGDEGVGAADEMGSKYPAWRAPAWTAVINVTASQSLSGDDEDPLQRHRAVVTPPASARSPFPPYEEYAT